MDLLCSGVALRSDSEPAIERLRNVLDTYGFPPVPSILSAARDSINRFFDSRALCIGELRYRRSERPLLNCALHSFHVKPVNPNGQPEEFHLVYEQEEPYGA